MKLIKAETILVYPHHDSHLTSFIKNVQFSSAVAHG